MESEITDRLDRLEIGLRLTQAAIRGLVMAHERPRIAATAMLEQIEAIGKLYADTPNEDAYLEAVVAARSHVLPSPKQWREIEGQ